MLFRSNEILSIRSHDVYRKRIIDPIHKRYRAILRECTVTITSYTMSDQETLRLFGNSEDDIQKAAQLLKDGKLVAFPTETVYGLGASVFNPEALKKVFQAKGRPADNPLIAHICSIEELQLLAEEIPEDAMKLAKAFFPGPLTIVLPAKKTIPREATGGLETIAIRMPNHPIALQLLKLSGPL